MDAKEKMNRLVSKTREIVNQLMEEAKKPSESVNMPPRANPSEMIRVTDSSGNEYFCPAGKLKDINFVSEREKSNCIDYMLIAQHDSMEA